MSRRTFSQEARKLAGFAKRGRTNLAVEDRAELLEHFVEFFVRHVIGKVTDEDARLPVEVCLGPVVAPSQGFVLGRGPVNDRSRITHCTRGVC